MTKTYCGKDCEQCAFGRANGCPGCQNGPGGSGECELAQCCRSKGHQSCDTCNFMQSCTTLHNREQLPIWHRRVNLEFLSVPSSEYSVWETIAPAAVVTGYLIEKPSLPTDELRNRKPADEFRELPGYRALP